MGFLNNDKLIVGYDLGNKYCQISYALSEGREPETLSQVAGAQNYNIPAVLCKRYGTNQWLYGREALRCADGQEGILVENLVSLAMDGETVMIDGESFDPVALLALFFKKSLGLLAQVSSRIHALMVTCSVLDRRILEVLTHIVESIQLRVNRVAVQSYAESFYCYMLRQPWELRIYPSVLFEYRQGGIRVLRMESNKRTTPIVVFVEESRYQFLEYAFGEGYGPEGEDSPVELGQEQKEMLDAAFLRIAEEVCGGETLGSIYLIGDGFGEDWMKYSLRYLCKGRRVFQGNNLFSKGACIGMQERLLPGESGKAYVFLGNDKLRANIGMKILRQGEESYYALLDAGVNWYEAERTLEVYIQDGNELALLITPLIHSASGNGGRSVGIALEGLSGNIARLRLHFFLKEENCLSVEVQDLGFGEFRVSAGKVWKEEIPIY
ncbi:MAG: hypothetical protein HFH91_09395 [Lachnospiraceae bacterium]|nr:hypothetical protein [Lachnospiraceae bacterium]